MIATSILGVLAILLNFVQSEGVRKVEIQFLANVNRIEQVQQAEPDEERILAATVEIKMSYLPAGSKSVDDQLMATGLGSLVRDGKKTLLITHNHWGEALRDMTVVTIYDVDHDVLKIMLGKEFKSLATYQDAGTLVLEAPQELAGSPSACGAKLGDSGQVESGDLVWVVYHQTGNRTEIGLLEAEVESVREYKGLPIFVLRSLGGLPVVGGDSGGGIWQDGQLVGNMWATVTKPAASNASVSSTQNQSVPQATDISYAALLP